MSKVYKTALYVVLALGLAAILFVMASSLLNPNASSKQKQSTNAKPAPVLGKLVTLDPRPARPHGAFLDILGNERHLSDFEGKVVLLNIWATWCVPCVKEMPSLDALQGQLGSENFEVVAISADRSEEDAKTFYTENQINHLAFYQDKSFEIVRGLYVKDYPSGLPISVLYDEKGRELARLSGGFDWVSEEATNRIEQAVSAMAPAP